MTGGDTGTGFRDADRVVDQYGGNPEDWNKVKSTSEPQQGAYGKKQEVHAVENSKTGAVVEQKIKLYEDSDTLPYPEDGK